MTSAIPSKLIHIYCPPKGQAGLPLVCRASRASAMTLNASYEHIFFGEVEMWQFVDREFPEYKETFKAFRLPIQRFDFFRYLVVYRLGGFYLDLDIFLAENLDSLRRHRCVFPFEELTINKFLRDELDCDWELGNYAFGAEPEHPFIRAVIENCARGVREQDWLKKMMVGIPKMFREPFFVTNTTGPGMVTRTFFENAHLQSIVTVLTPEDVCDERGWHRFGNVGVHLMNAGWRRKMGFFRAKCARFWENRLRRQLLRHSVQIGATRTGPWNTEIYPL